MFREYLLEYLTQDQKDRYSQYKMTDKARADTDHFFGVGKDKKVGDVYKAPYEGAKSEAHKAIEQHFGHEVSHSDYVKGTLPDPKYPGREVKFSKKIKDPAVAHLFHHDPIREGVRSKSNKYSFSTHRGTEVAGQTNSAKTDVHPNGHSWINSCKNITGKGTNNGCNRHYVIPEIEHGTLVHFVHDHTGKEIYRAALQPHHNKNGSVAYSVNAEYGVMHPSFRASAREAALAASHPTDHEGSFNMHHSVYGNGKMRSIQHPAKGGGVNMDNNYANAMDMGGKVAHNFLTDHDNGASDQELANVIDRHYSDIVENHLRHEEEYANYHTHPNAGPLALHAQATESNYHHADIMYHPSVGVDTLDHILDDHNSGHEEHHNLIHNIISHPDVRRVHLASIPGNHAEHIDSTHISALMDHHEHGKDMGLLRDFTSDDVHSDHISDIIPHLHRHEHVDDETLAHIADKHGATLHDDDVESLMNHPKAGPITHAEIAYHNPEMLNPKQLHAVAMHPKTPLYTHKEIVDHEDLSHEGREMSKWKMGNNPGYGHKLHASDPETYDKHMVNDRGHAAGYMAHNPITGAVIDHAKRLSGRFGSGQIPHTSLMASLVKNPEAADHDEIVNHVKKNYPREDADKIFKNSAGGAEQRGFRLTGGDEFDRTAASDTNRHTLKGMYANNNHDAHSIDKLVNNRSYSPTATDADNLISANGHKMGERHHEDLYHALAHDVDRASHIRHHGDKLPDHVFDHAINRGSVITRAAAKNSPHLPSHLR